MGRCTFQSEENIPSGTRPLGGKYRTLDATLGIDGQSGSPAGPVSIRVIDKTNGSLLRDCTFTSGKSVQLRRFGVAGVTILRFEFLGPLSTSMAAVGSPIACP
ncbi:hypothetical protein ACWDU8_04190 [Streptomyces sp. NPDC003388]